MPGIQIDVITNQADRAIRQNDSLLQRWARTAQSAIGASNKLSQGLGGIGRAAERGAQGIRRTESSIRQANQGFSALTSQVKGFVAAYAGVAGLRGSLGISSELQEAENRLRVASDGVLDYSRAFAIAENAATTYKTSLSVATDSVAEFSRLASFGVISVKELERGVDGLSSTFQAFGVTATNQELALYGLRQTLTDTRVTMENYRQIIENIPGSELIFNVEALREYGKTARAVIEDGIDGATLFQKILLPAFEKSADKLGALQVTLLRQSTDLRNEYSLLTRDLGDPLGKAGIASLKLLTDAVSNLRAAITNSDLIGAADAIRTRWTAAWSQLADTVKKTWENAMSAIAGSNDRTEESIVKGQARLITNFANTAAAIIEVMGKAANLMALGFGESFERIIDGFSLLGKELDIFAGVVQRDLGARGIQDEIEKVQSELAALEERRDAGGVSEGGILGFGSTFVEDTPEQITRVNETIRVLRENLIGMRQDLADSDAVFANTIGSAASQLEALYDGQRDASELEARRNTILKAGKELADSLANSYSDASKASQDAAASARNLAESQRITNKDTIHLSTSTEKTSESVNKLKASLSNAGASASDAGDDLKELMSRLFPVKELTKQFEEDQALLLAQFGDTSLPEYTEALKRLTQEYKNTKAELSGLADLESQFDKNVDKIISERNNRIEDISRAAQTSFETLRDGWKSVLDSLLDTSRSWSDRIKDALVEGLKNALASMLAAVGSGISIPVNAVGGGFGGTGGGNIVSSLAGAPGGGFLQNAFGTPGSGSIITGLVGRGIQYLGAGIGGGFGGGISNAGFMLANRGVSGYLGGFAGLAGLTGAAAPAASLAGSAVAGVGNVSLGAALGTGGATTGAAAGGLASVAGYAIPAIGAIIALASYFGNKKPELKDSGLEFHFGGANTPFGGGAQVYPWAEYKGKKWFKSFEDTVLGDLDNTLSTVVSERVNLSLTSVVKAAENAGNSSAQDIIDGFETHFSRSMGKEISEQNIADGIDLFVNATVAQAGARLFAGIRHIYDTLSDDLQEIGRLGAAIQPLLGYIDSTPLEDYSEALRAQSRTFSGAIQEIDRDIASLTATFDYSLSSVEQISALVQQRYDLEIKALAEVTDLIAAINTGFSSSIRDQQLAGLDTSGQIEFLSGELQQIRQQALGAAASGDSALLNALASQFLQTQNRIFTLEDQLAPITGGSIAAAYGLQPVNTVAQQPRDTTDRINILEGGQQFFSNLADQIGTKLLDSATDSRAEITELLGGTEAMQAVSKNLIDSGTLFQTSTDKFSESVDTFAQAVTTSAASDNGGGDGFGGGGGQGVLGGARSSSESSMQALIDSLNGQSAEASREQSSMSRMLAQQQQQMAEQQTALASMERELTAQTRAMRSAAEELRSMAEINGQQPRVVEITRTAEVGEAV